jgi:6-phosphogluconolactonase/glucosamine-6-phosphate isomerase/deaminase
MKKTGRKENMTKKVRPFPFTPAPFIPFKDKAELERVRKMSGEQLTHHKNPDFKIKIVKDDLLEHIFVTDMFAEIKLAAEEGRKVVLIIPNPNPGYRKLAMMINRFHLDCKHVYTFNMDEWADQDGNIAPETYAASFMRSTKKFFYSEILPELRMPESQMVGPSTKNITHYSDMIAQAGGADCCYSGPGWTGHLAFIEPDVPEFAGSLEEFLKMGARVTTLNPLTIAQNSLHGCFGCSGDIASVPPKAATIGPRDVFAAKRRMEIHGITTSGTFVTWQRMISRLVLHGPVTPSIPSSILQLVPTDVYVTETLAAPIEPDWEFQY